ncbi:hypothetical protein [Seonamhaeicola maritimus]|uniref:hypothetical protein n=1 Tax=Seonamhaeicola maritimus TaxID=2591822 RepID=UPI002493EA9E|nr:hypothetical protein [Seonamhaeicola maritimus]
MKTKILILVTVFLTLTSCSLSNDTNEGPIEVTLVHWNLINVTGGIAGVDNDFEVGDIVWNADEFNSMLAVNNSNPDDTIEDGLDTGTYDFVLFETGGDIFTVIDGDEFGKIYISETDNTLLIIDQNELSFGPQADGFIYTFKITTSTIEI